MSGAVTTIDTGRGFKSAQSLKVTASGTTTINDTFASMGGNGGGLRLGLLPGRTYRISGRISVPAATGLSTDNTSRRLRLVAFTRTPTVGYRDAAVSNMRASVDAWQPVGMDLTVPADATEAFVRLYNGFAASSATTGTTKAAQPPRRSGASLFALRTAPLPGIHSGAWADTSACLVIWT